MWKTPAASASSNGLCEGWDRFTVPRFAWTGHFHGCYLLASPVSLTGLIKCENVSWSIFHLPPSLV